MATTKKPYATPTLDVIVFGENDVILTSRNMDDDGWTGSGRLRNRINEWTESGVLDDGDN